MLACLRGLLYCVRRSIGFDDSGAAGLKARMRWLVEIPQADASVDSYDDALDFGRVVGMSSSSRPKLSRAVEMSLSAPRAEMPKAPSSTEGSEPLDFGREFSSHLAEPAVARPSLAFLLGMNLSAAWCGRRIVVLPALDLTAPSLLVRSFDGEAVTGPVPTRVKSEIPRSRCFGDLFDLAMFDFGDWA